MRGDSGTDTGTAGPSTTSTVSSGSPSILVVGDGLVATATTGFLEAAGLNPVLAPSIADNFTATVRVLWEPGLALLERIGLRRSVERLGTHIAGLHCLTSDTRWTDSDAAGGPLVAIESARLQSLLERQFRGLLTETERVVTAIEPTMQGVRATFEGTTTELFDAAITTARSFLPCHDRVLTEQTVDTWEFACSDAGITRDVMTEAWGHERAAFSVPVSQGRSIRLVSVAETPANAALATDMLAEQFGQLTPGASFEALDHTDLHYRRVPYAVPRRLVADGIALVGPETRVSMPGDWMGATLGIEDAWVIADTLADGPPEVATALAEYARRRRRRVRDIIESSAVWPVQTAGSAEPMALLRPLCTKRRHAIGYMVDQPVQSVAEDVLKDR